MVIVLLDTQCYYYMMSAEMKFNDFIRNIVNIEYRKQNLIKYKKDDAMNNVSNFMRLTIT